MSTAWDIFNQALLELTGPGTQRERLCNAYSPSLRTLRRKEVPKERRDELDLLQQLLGDSRNELQLKQTVASLSQSQMNTAISTILSINDQLARYQPREP